MPVDLTNVPTLPGFQCTKFVVAAKILAVSPNSTEDTVLLDLEGYGTLTVSGDYHRKHLPVIGGYYVRYSDGYESFSPAKAFEDGYTPAPRPEYAGLSTRGLNLENNFTYHAPFGTQTQRYVALRDFALRLARLIEAYTPPSREQSLAFTKLEECVMWANAAIARNEKPAVEAPDQSKTD